MFVSSGLVLGFDVGACGGCVVLGGDSSFGGCGRGGCGGRRVGCLGGRGFTLGVSVPLVFSDFSLSWGISGSRMPWLSCRASRPLVPWLFRLFRARRLRLRRARRLGVVVSWLRCFAVCLFLLEVDGVAFFVHDAVLQVGQRLVGDEAEADAEVAAPASVKA